MSRSQVKKVGTTTPDTSKTESVQDVSQTVDAAPSAEMVDAIGLVKTKDGWVHATFRVPLSMAVKRTEPELRFIAVESFKRAAVYNMIGEKV